MEIELETIKKPKFECPNCQKKFSKLHRCKDGIKRCKRCEINRVTNKFYVPITERKISDKNGKYTLSRTEKKELFRELIRKGLSEEEARNRIRLNCFQLRKNWFDDRSRKRYWAQRKEQEAIQSIENKKRLIEGLR